MGFFKKRKRLHPHKKTIEVSLTPLIDTALTLLIIFMITSPMMNNAIKVDLPSGKAKEDGAGKPQLVLYVEQNNTIYFNDKPISIDQIVPALSGQEQKQDMVYVKADQKVSYGRVIEIVDMLKTAITNNQLPGITSVALATKKM